jgi:Helix-turn-helix
MAVDARDVREVIERVFARSDVLNACKRHDFSTILTVLGANGVTQGQIAALMGKTTQGRLSEYKTRKRDPTMETLERFADCLGLASAARLALGLASEASGSSEPAGGQPAVLSRGSDAGTRRR